MVDDKINIGKGLFENFINGTVPVSEIAKRQILNYASELSKIPLKSINGLYLKIVENYHEKRKDESFAGQVLFTICYNFINYSAEKFSLTEESKDKLISRLQRRFIETDEERKVRGSDDLAPLKSENGSIIKYIFRAAKNMAVDQKRRDRTPIIDVDIGDLRIADTNTRKAGLEITFSDLETELVDALKKKKLTSNEWVAMTMRYCSKLPEGEGFVKFTPSKKKKKEEVLPFVEINGFRSYRDIASHLATNEEAIANILRTATKHFTQFLQEKYPDDDLVQQYTKYYFKHGKVTPKSKITEEKPKQKTKNPEQITADLI